MPSGVPNLMLLPISWYEPGMATGRLTLALPSGNYSNQYGIQLESIARSQFVCHPGTHLRHRVIL
ncbi:hypothetical protein K501DRAFT_85799 [Backusella circina FSU 941]|nr:hypothetical protein K501DRAFT_85799 [Backusella circina FSU 941]